MPLYKYLILNNSINPEYIEIEQSVNDSPLKTHPLTGEPVQKVFQSPSLTLKYSSANEKKTLSPDHLEKNGFSVLQKDTNSKEYIQTVGKNPNLDRSNG